MMSSSSVAPLRQQGGVEDPLMALLRSRHRRFRAKRIEAEAEPFLCQMRGLRLADDCQRAVRHGMAENACCRPASTVSRQRGKLRDRDGGEAGTECIRFTSPWTRHQSCTVHNSTDALDGLFKSV